MLTSSIINQDALQAQINNEVERLTAVKFEQFKNNLLEEISKNYYFDDKFLTREQVAEKLELSIGTVDNLRKSGKLKGSRAGKLVRFKNSEVLAYMKNLKPC